MCHEAPYALHCGRPTGARRVTGIYGAMSSRQRGSAPREPVSSERWTARVLPLALLIVLALAGLRGAVAAPRWDGPLHRYGFAIGIGLVAVLVTLLVLTWRRRRAALAGRGPDAELDVAAKLRTVLMVVLSGGIATTIVTMLVALHLHLFNSKPPRPRAKQPSPRQPPRNTLPSVGREPLDVPFTDILYALLVVALIAAIVIAIRWSARIRPPARLPGHLLEDEDHEDLREAVESGRSALRARDDDVRAAIIACYLAMEQRLAERGAKRSVADTPDELLARATRSKIVRGTAPARLTALFYEARFSSHPMNQSQRQVAEQALDELAAALTQPESAAQASG